MNEFFHPALDHIRGCLTGIWLQLVTFRDINSLESSLLLASACEIASQVLLQTKQKKKKSQNKTTLKKNTPKQTNRRKKKKKNRRKGKAALLSVPASPFPWPATVVPRLPQHQRKHRSGATPAAALLEMVQVG